MPILDRLHDPAELRGMSEPELAQLAAEIRETIIRTVAVTGDISGRRWVSSRSPSPSTASWSRRATGSCGTPATRRTPTAADRPPVALPHPAPDRRHRRLPAAQRVAARRVRRRPRRDRAVSIARASPRPGHAHSMERIAVVVATPRCCQAVRSRRSTTSATADPAPDRAQRQRECRQPVGGRAVQVPVRDQALDRVATEQDVLGRRHGADPDRRRAARGAVAPHSPVRRVVRQPGHCSRTWASPTWA